MTSALIHVGMRARTMAGSGALAVVLSISPITDAGPTAPAADDVGATVTMTATKFTPETVEIKAGQTVLWKNTSAKAHTVTADPARAKDPKHVELPAGVAPFDSGRIKQEASYSHTFTTPGRYTYFCIPHEEMGMVGHVIVH